MRRSNSRRRKEFFAQSPESDDFPKPVSSLNANLRASCLTVAEYKSEIKLLALRYTEVSRAKIELEHKKSVLCSEVEMSTLRCVVWKEGRLISEALCLLMDRCH